MGIALPPSRRRSGWPRALRPALQTTASSYTYRARSEAECPRSAHRNQIRRLVTERRIGSSCDTSNAGRIPTIGTMGTTTGGNAGRILRFYEYYDGWQHRPRTYHGNDWPSQGRFKAETCDE
jgi:hypothetical protein